MKTLIVLAWTFFRLSFLCIGGGLSAVPEMQRQVVSVHGWLTAREFVDGYALSQITPGPTMLVVTFIGYRVAGGIGALLATAAMFLPSAAFTWVVVRCWSRLQGRPWAVAIERALPPLAIGLMAAGVYTVGRTAVTDRFTALLAVAAALVLARKWAPAIAVIAAAGVVGWLLSL